MVLPKENDAQVDVSRLIAANSWGVQVCRAENNHYYAVVQVPPSGSYVNDWIKIYRNTGDPSVDAWTYIIGFYNNNHPLSYPDIEIVSSNNKGYVIYNTGVHYVSLFWFNLDAVGTNGFVAIEYDGYTTANLNKCSITSDEIEFSGAGVYLYACYRVWDYVESVWMIGYKRSTDSGLTWANEAFFGAGENNLPTGNAIAYCPGDNRVHVCFSNTYWDVGVQESSTYGIEPWTYTNVMSSSTYNIYAWGITSNYDNYILVTADAIVSSPDFDVLYAYSSDGGTSWSSTYYFNWAGDQEYASCSSNEQGYFGLFYYYDNGSTQYWMESSYNVYSSLGSTSSWDYETVDEMNYYEGTTAACIEDGTSPRFGGAWSTGGSSTANSYFGWDRDTVVPVLYVNMDPVSPPIIIPASGGSFNFNVSGIRILAPQSAFWVWSRDRYPSGSYTGNLLGPVQINPPVGVSISRQRTQNVPSYWPGGAHYYIGYAHTNVSYPATDVDSFGWVKLITSNDNPFLWETACTGELFPGEIPMAGLSIPSEFALLAAAPNPFNPTTAISYKLQASSFVSLRVYDTAGRLVTELVNGWREAGNHEVTFDGSGLASGVYLYTLTAGANHATGKMVLMK